MSKKTWIIFAVICVGIIAGLIYLSGGSKIDVSNVDAFKIQPASEQSGNIADHIYGNKDSKVVIFEYGDYQCPGCGNSYPVIKQVSEKYKDQIALVFRNFPLTSLHPNALAAATAAEAAGKEGKFWEMHNVLFSNQDAWNQLSSVDRTNYFVSQAKELGLDQTAYRAAFDDKSIQQKISFDTALGKKLNIQSTPTIYVNDKLISDLRFDGNKLSTDTNAAYVWTSATALENLVIKPALEKAGISVKD